MVETRSTILTYEDYLNTLSSPTLPGLALDLASIFPPA